jgi:hypothetical protein
VEEKENGKKERTEEQLETFKIKSLREFSKKKNFSYDLSLEHQLLNLMISLFKKENELI